MALGRAGAPTSCHFPHSQATESRQRAFSAATTHPPQQHSLCSHTISDSLSALVLEGTFFWKLRGAFEEFSEHCLIAGWEKAFWPWPAGGKPAHPAPHSPGIVGGLQPLCPGDVLWISQAFSLKTCQGARMGTPPWGDCSGCELNWVGASGLTWQGDSSLRWGQLRAMCWA